jgi:hypothetical protein
MRIILDLFDELDGDLITYDSFTGTPDEVMDALAKLYVSDDLIEEVDRACTNLYGELPGAEVEVASTATKYFANIRKA